ncbi:Sugar kinase of the NBD/HSP70 family, may contain an N-terminal HTH domain [Streptomyces sp. 2112.3]|nr:putative NBD/HSP70 family sugar kinase [Streptomyces sp. 2321.6]SDR49657.1 Sugar kinase of the NBD/HSP70 family, may contain an N-terminal HTH domain [Streptomyces sp. KS_16]SEC57858.1 Sugar kinase of the NBD/HSP70 family, may contain an N-terminal HTH domain [Streptomyces sp. 2133.1]SEE97597.1 Sugar kinase of the NBD/HSP70 family, may contain an N-terminal HTH domain [Streptomyces sp. 2112.3]SNC68404.1 Sugar kinase of the NBD/HSP70 family, may contain an N-terminal HTH domain [Streptomyces 
MAGGHSAQGRQGTPGIRGTPGTPRVLRAMNDRAALDLLVSQGPLTRTRIGELTGLSKPTASQLLARLEAAGLVRTTGNVTGRPGPSAQLYEIDPVAAHVAALAVDPLGITAAVADITGQVLGEERVNTDAVAGEAPHRTAQLVARAVDGALARAGLARGQLHGAVIGTPGALDPRTGRLRYAPHLPGWHARALKDELTGVLGTPVTLENDVNLAAVAEQHDGAAQDVDDFVLVWADKGVGAALVLGGRLLRGATGGAGEIGYLPLPGAPLTRGGDHGSARADAGGGFQQLVGSPAVLALAREYGAPDVRTVEGAMAHDGVRAEIARRLATGIAAVVAVVDPRLVVLSGEVPRAGGQALRALVEEEFTGLPLSRPAVRLSHVDGPPILTGALRTALATARDAVFHTG